MSPIASYWMPAETSNVLNPNPHARPVVGVVKGMFHQSLDLETYLALLAARLTFLFEQEANPQQAFREAIFNLEEGLGLQLTPELANQDGSEVTMAQNCQLLISELSAYLRQLNIPGRLPLYMPPNLLEAQRVYDETDLESWISNLLERPINPDR